MPEISVVIVNYNTRDQLRRCLNSLGDEAEAIVVDNASTDGSVAMLQSEFAGVKLIANDRNRGFGAANNQGAELATAPLILYLNSDAWAKPNALSSLASAMADPMVAAAGGKLLNPDGTLQESCANDLTLWAVFCEQTYLERLFPNSRLLSPYWLSARLLRETQTASTPVAQVMGACLMTRNQEAFDERFFLYCEDTELCHRLRRHGSIVYVPKAEFFHELGTSSVKSRWLAIARYNRGKELHFQIHRSKASSLACFLLNRLGALARLLVWTLACMATLGTRHRAKVACFWRVLTVPLAGPARP